MTTLPRLGLPMISSQQAQPEVTHNTALLMIQAILGGVAALQNAPPGAPDDGDAYIVGTAPTGLWSGEANKLAIFLGGWVFVPGVDSDGVEIAMGADQAGLSVYDRATSTQMVWSGAAWGAASGAAALSDLADVGITTPLDGQVLTYDAGSDTWINADLPVESDSSDGGGIVLTEFAKIPTLDVHNMTTFSSGFFGCRAIIMEFSGTINSIRFGCGTLAATAKMIPAIYANNAGSMGALLSQGPQVTGATVGINTLPLSTPVDFVKGDVLWIGMQVTVASINAWTSPGKGAAFFSSSGALPNPPSSVTYADEGWTNMWATSD